MEERRRRRQCERRFRARAENRHAHLDVLRVDQVRQWAGRCSEPLLDLRVSICGGDRADDVVDRRTEPARELALAKRPEVREAQLKIQAAKYDRRIKKSEYIPDISVGVRYESIQNVKLLPQNILQAGFQLTWEPFDWGRKRREMDEIAKTAAQAETSLPVPSMLESASWSQVGTPSVRMTVKLRWHWLVMGEMYFAGEEVSNAPESYPY